MPVNNPRKIILYPAPGRSVLVAGKLVEHGESVEIVDPVQISTIGAQPPPAKYARIDLESPDQDGKPVITSFVSDGSSWRQEDNPAPVVSKRKRGGDHT